MYAGISTYSVAHTVSTHRAAITGVSLHPTGDYFATAGADKMWALHDMATGSTRVQLTSEDQSGIGYIFDLRFVTKTFSVLNSGVL